MDLKVFIVLFSLLAISINANEATDSDEFYCEDCKCVDDGATHPFLRGDDFALCVYFVGIRPDIFKGTTNWTNYTRAVYPVKVDQYTVVTLKDAFTKLISKENYYHLKIVVQGHGSTKSFPIPFYNSTSKDGSFFAKNYSVVIQMNNGRVQNITWDNKCSTCDLDECYTAWHNGTLFDAVCLDRDCIRNKTNATECDPQIFISWIGSDKDGDKMTSAGMRVSRFNQYSWASIYAEAQTYLTSNSGEATGGETGGSTGGTTGGTTGGETKVETSGETKGDIKVEGS